jgi:hypothetical protein
MQRRQTSECRSTHSPISISASPRRSKLTAGCSPSATTSAKGKKRRSCPSLLAIVDSSFVWSSLPEPFGSQKVADSTELSRTAEEAEETCRHECTCEAVSFQEGLLESERSEYVPSVPKSKGGASHVGASGRFEPFAWSSFSGPFGSRKLADSTVLVAAAELAAETYPKRHNVLVRLCHFRRCYWRASAFNSYLLC